MKRTLSILLAAALVLGMTTQSDAAQRSRRKEEPPPPPQFKVDVATRSFELSRLAVSVPAGSTVGTAHTTCTSFLRFPGESGQAVTSDMAFRGARDADYISAFAAEAAAAGYKLPASANGNLFETQDAKAELIVGAGIVALEVSGCYLAGTYKGYPFLKADLKAKISVDWQVFDPLEKKLLFRTTTEGLSSIKSDQEGRTGIIAELARDAFRNSAKLVVADPNFVAAVKDPRGGAATANSSLFPEATNAAAIPATSKQIARLPLSTMDFRTNVGGIREQVVTILTPGGSGSGFYISNELLLTNHHVIDGFTDVRINFFGGRQVAGTVIASDARRDIALVKTEAQAFAGLPLRLENPEVASQVFVIGSPLDPKNEGSVSAGIVSGFRDHDFGPMLQSDVGVTFGNSGGPMFDDKGNVIALTDLGIPDQNGGKTQVNLFIPIADGLKKLNIELGPDTATAQK